MSQKNISRRRLLKLLGLGIAGTALAACQPKVVKETVVVEKEKVVKEEVEVEKEVTRVVEKEAEKAAPGQITLTVLGRAGFQGDAHRHFYLEFMDDHPNVRIEGIPTSYADIPKKSEAMYRSGEFPDVSYQAIKWSHYLANKGLFMYLDDMAETYWEEYDFDDFYSSFLNAVRLEGKLYGLPEFSQPTSRPFVVINVDMYEEAGIPVPEGPNYDIYEWRDAAIKLTKPDEGIFGASPPGITNFYDWDAFVDGFDTHILDQEVGLAKRFNWLDNDLNKEAVDWYLSFMENHAAPRRGEELPEVNMFASGLYASQRDGSYAIPSLTKEIGEKFNWSMYLMEGPTRRGTGIFVNPWCISSQTEHADVAFEFVAGTLCGKEIGPWSFQTGLGSGLQARKSEWNSDLVANAHPAYGVMRDWMNEEGDEFNPFPMPYNFRFQELWDTYEQNVDPLAYLEVSWEEQAPLIQERCQAVMDQPR